MTQNTNQIKELANTVRLLAADGVEKAKSGHPGMPMGAADYASLLWADFLKFNPQDPSWPNRDRFVLSAGHGCMLLYSLLHLFGYDVSNQDLQSFRQWESKTPGHPEFGMTSGVETTTGPLGQGFANGVGLALSSKLLAQSYSAELFNYRVYGIVSDGDLMEGVASEAASIAGHLGLNNLIYFYDDNHISIGGSTDVCFTESVPKRFEAYNWYVQSVDGHDVEAIRACVQNAIKEEKRPSIICCRTTIGFGSPHKANDPEVHGAPLGEEELKATRQKLNRPETKFFVPEQTAAFCKEALAQKKAEYTKWQAKFDEWAKANPEKAAQWKAQSTRELPCTLKDALIKEFAEGKKDSTRNLSGKAINVIAKHVPFFIGGSADLEPSTKTLIKGSADIQKGQFAGRNLRFGVREHGMGSLANGLAYCRCWVPYTATFLVFADYMRPPMRVAAISHLQSLFVYTHDSFFVGEDGPTHQPIEHIASLRIIPNLHVHRPADGLETAMCYYAALQRKNGPSSILCTRQDLPALERPAGFKAEDILKGAYVVHEAANAQYTLVATGSEVWVAVAAAKLLAASGVALRVVSMPCQELFLEQDKVWQESILPAAHKKISLEAGLTTGWERIVGSSGLTLGLNHFGASAPAGVLAEKFGFTPEAVKERIMKWLAK